jgi:hypothetical protein
MHIEPAQRPRAPRRLQDEGQAATPALFSPAGPTSAAGNHGGSMLFLRGADHENRARFAQ